VRVLITGAAGFLGRWFLDYHVKAGDDVTAIDDLSNNHSYWPMWVPIGSYRKIEMELGMWLELYSERDYDRVYHFAAPVGGRLKIELDPLFNADSLRIDSLVFRWAISHTPVLVYPSSSAVYGTTLQDSNTSAALYESEFDAGGLTWFAPDEMYGFTKMAGERLALSASHYGLNTLCIRPFSGYGEGQSLEYPVPSIARRAFRREDPLIVWGSGEQRRDFIHVSDVVGATLARLEGPLVGYEAMNIGSGVSTSFRQIAELCAEIVGYEPTIQTDSTKPEGVVNRWADTGLMSVYYQPKVALRDGLGRVVDYAAAMDRLRE